MDPIITLNLLKESFERMQKELITENEKNNVMLTTPKDEFLRLNMIQYRQGAIDMLESSIVLIDNLIKCENDI